MFSNTLASLALGTIAITAVQAAYVGDAAAVTACQGFAPGSLKCLSDVSFVVCRGGYEVEQFVAAGTRCEQGIPYQRKDAIVAGAATATRSFLQYPPASSSSPPAASSAPPSSSPPIPSSIAASTAPVSTAPPLSSDSQPPMSSSVTISNSISVVSGSATAFATTS